MPEPHPLIAARWSPRVLDPAADVSDDAVRTLLEAARWAPSFGNSQPARYLVGRRGDRTFERIAGLLTPRNGWATAAGALLLACADTVNAKGEVPYAEYGVGLANENLVLQAVALGLVAHQMAGFDKDGARREFALPDHVLPLVVIAVGALGEETRPDKGRLPLERIAFAGDWGTPF